jgi:hypothetical protein
MDRTVGTELVPVGPEPTGDVRRYACRNAGCNWTGMRRNMNIGCRNIPSRGSIVGLYCPKCDGWIRDA